MWSTHFTGTQVDKEEEDFSSTATKWQTKHQKIKFD